MTSIAEHREAFDRFDPTDAGRINVSDAVTALNQLGLPCGSTDVRDGNCTGNDTQSHPDFPSFYFFCKSYKYNVISAIQLKRPPRFDCVAHHSSNLFCTWYIPFYVESFMRFY